MVTRTHHNIHRKIWMPSLCMESEEYKDRVKKDVALREIIREMTPYTPNLTIASVKIKIKSIRTQYRKEQRLIEKSSVSGAGRGQLYTPKLWSFPILKFLDDGEAPTTPISTLSEQSILPTEVS